ncbi:OB-fold protein [Winogradskyella flava]|uniref:tRNA_anti-like n=1 Tax=Winogradskyella flava TaxID=1884876 RepID=A0A842IP05_9FLAO|nr:hypothetical protein [Winogradskyella flava]MBC2844395.1 hypothetical protein [Winogradskyella flava]
MKRKKIIALLSIFVLILVAFFVYDYTFNSKHRDIANEEATVVLSAVNLFNDFQKDEAVATTKYLDKVIEIKGSVSAIEDNAIVLNNQIQVGFNIGETPKLTNGTALTIKGRCVGYDELLEMVKIDQATVINK